MPRGHTAHLSTPELLLKAICLPRTLLAHLCHVDGSAVNQSFVSLQRGAVIQSPMATVILHELPRFPGLLILFLARDCIDVYRSQNRVMPNVGGWTCFAGRTRELRKYRRKAELAGYFDPRDMICTIKQHVWLRYQRPLLLSHELGPEFAPSGLNLTATVDFESFRTHPRWLSGSSRARLSIKSTNCENLAHTPRRTHHDKQWMDMVKSSGAGDVLWGVANEMTGANGTEVGQKGGDTGHAKAAESTGTTVHAADHGIIELEHNGAAPTDPASTSHLELQGGADHLEQLQVG